MAAYIVMTTIALLAFALGYFVGHERAIENEARRWLAVVHRTEAEWTAAYRSMHQSHAILAEALLGALNRAKGTIAELRARLDATATPSERKN